MIIIACCGRKYFFFFFQAEDGIRDKLVTGVQTCALPISVIDQAYDLEVSSPGLDRVLRKDREFEWALGKPVRCWLAGGQEHSGRLMEVAPERLVLDHDGERVELLRGVVTKARLDVDVPWPRA